MAKIYFETKRITAVVFPGSNGFTLVVNKKNEKSVAFVEDWIKRKDRREVMLWYNKKAWIFLDCKVFSHNKDKGVFNYHSSKKYLTVNIDYDRGVIVTKDSEYRKKRWVNEARNLLIREYKENKLKDE